MTLDEIRTITAPVLRRHAVEFAAVFGSHARGEAKANSDVDILVRYAKPTGLGHVRLAYELEDLLKKKVDLVTEKSVDKYIKSNVARDLQIIYGQRQQI